ncbi:zinc finger BED domain-containing protein RICESLEEPER 2-like isoform X1 [Juglans microcarpa x Juglans regia]|uniref:zinc finger BED domain-containing protein RICESLEEPER 2-like isoform X1 n=1 Tax=Juglans microcarpa x Juglans regia TaxID=2249226 RepID=UPI001B7F1B14|nr:zinc finger BED domain-containing protein RICESLEEPER 2-like isoform X1 [Juglans microcarpa x Juglans regia]XP_040986115.1 zinc finger BED domain-containing protein RICESLEEPER 2-like isoform X1 [Juglans microcarpa x Juglans regia]
MRIKDDVIRQHHFIHIRCFAHIINLIVVEGLKEIDDSITRVRSIVRYVRASPQRLAKFKAITEQLQIGCSSMLCLDVPTRWNSTYIMLDVAQKYQRAFEQMEVEDEGLRYALLELAGQGLSAPDAHDWTSVRYLIQFLKFFYDITMRIFGSKYTTANLYFSELSELHFHLKNSCADSRGLLSAMTARMKTKYDKY